MKKHIEKHTFLSFFQSFKVYFLSFKEWYEVLTFLKEVSENLYLYNLNEERIMIKHPKPFLKCADVLDHKTCETYFAKLWISSSLRTSSKTAFGYCDSHCKAERFE